MVLLAGGILAVWAARSSVSSNANVFPAANKDHIHMAYAINDCGKWLAPIPTFESSFGIHTHGDGVLHIHPYLASASGKNATFSVFENGAGMSSSPSGLRYTGVNVKGDCNGKAAVLRVAEWNKVVDKNDKPISSSTKPDRIYTKDFGKIRLNHNGGALTFFYGSPTATIPMPPSIPAMIIGPRRQRERHHAHHRHRHHGPGHHPQGQRHHGGPLGHHGDHCGAPDHGRGQLTRR